MQRQLNSLTRSLVSTPVIWVLPPVLVLRSAGFGFQTPLFHPVIHQGHLVWRLTQFSSMLHPSLLVDRLPMRVHVLLQGLASHAESQDTMHMTALKPTMLHSSLRTLLAMVSHHARRSVSSQPTEHGRVHHVSAKDAHDDPDVVLGTLLVNCHPASVLFDTGASHSFISEGYARLHDISFCDMLTPLEIQTPGSRWQTTRISYGNEILEFE